MEQQEVRAALERLAYEHRVSLAALSRMLRRNAAYLQQFVKRGTPKRLEERDRALLASYFRVGEEVLGGSQAKALAQVARLDVQVSAGPGSLEDSELQIGSYGFDPAWLRSISQAKPEDLSIVRVTGDSMASTLADGDDVLVDSSRRGLMLRDGIYVLRRDETLMVKRLTQAPGTGALTISSDNPAYPSWHDVSADSVIVVGRVIWAGRKLA